MGGETSQCRWSLSYYSGLSPRGRGNRSFACSVADPGRSIPAWAGKPQRRVRLGNNDGVYPRVGGETKLRTRQPILGKGLSPRGRGNLDDFRVPTGICGSIPAWAGKPSRAITWPATSKVYPRVGGETRWNCLPTDRAWGLSPRGRGNRISTDTRRLLGRSIPAWAGKPRRAACGAARRAVYPRVGGETPLYTSTRTTGKGLSPRGRGNQEAFRVDRRGRRSIPAWAGKPTAISRRPTTSTVYPRVGGETVTCGCPSSAAKGLSPRGRGNRRLDPGGRDGRGSIPAWAGKPRRRRNLRADPEVYPRVGGETGVG